MVEDRRAAPAGWGAGAAAFDRGRARATDGVPAREAFRRRRSGRVGRRLVRRLGPRLIEERDEEPLLTLDVRAEQGLERGQVADEIVKDLRGHEA